MKEIFKSVFLNLLGDQSADFYITFFIFVLLGVLASLSYSAIKRDKYSERTPVKFNVLFWLFDNAPRFLANMAFIFIIIRLGSELFGLIPDYKGAVILGVCSDRLAWLMEKLRAMGKGFAAK